MSDISKCANGGCPSRKSCYRYTAPAEKYQSYSTFVVKAGEDRCGWYWKATPTQSSDTVSASKRRGART